MPNLGDYLGYLLSEVTNARVQADLEAVRIAQFYASDPLLRHMPVPHFRLPSLTLDLPVIIKDMEEKKEITPGENKDTIHKMTDAFERLFKSQIKQMGFELSPTDRANLNKELDLKISRIDLSSRMPLNVMSIGNELVSTTSKFMQDISLRKKDAVSSISLNKFNEELKTAVYAEFSKFLPEPPRVNVLVTTAELREAGPSERLVKIHLSITEDTLECVEVESNGKLQSRLVSE